MLEPDQKVLRTKRIENAVINICYFNFLHPFHCLARGIVVDPDSKGSVPTVRYRYGTGMVPTGIYLALMDLDSHRKRRQKMDVLTNKIKSSPS